MVNFTNDVFISYSRADQEWVQNELLERLEQAGLHVIIDHRDFALDQSPIDSMTAAARQSRKIIFVLSSHTEDEKWAHFAALLAQISDSASQQQRLIPLLLEPCELRADLAMLTPADFTNPLTRDKQMLRLLRTLGGKYHVFICYGRGLDPDERLAIQMAAYLQRAGHTVFSNQKLPLNMEWATQIQRQIEASDCVVVLLSAAAVQSEMLTNEVEYIYRLFQKAGRPRIIPVRVKYSEILPYPLSVYLDWLRAAEWGSPADTRRLMVQLHDAIGHRAVVPSSVQAQIGKPIALAQVAAPTPSADPRFIESLDEPSGTMRLSSKFYIARTADTLLRSILARPRGTTTTIRAPRQSGKSSLLIRGVAQAREAGSAVVFLDLQAVDDLFLQNLDSFLRYISNIIVSRLGLDLARAERFWFGSLGTTDKMTYLMEDYVLNQAQAKKLVLAIDEADRLLNTPFHNSFFGLMRVWHNNRAQNELWERLDLLMVIATEPSILIQNLHQSPFNVGQTIKLEDLDKQQVTELNMRYNSPVQAADLPALFELLNGHPYLTSRALYTMLTQQITWQQLIAVAPTDQGPFGDHLRHYVWILHNRPELYVALKEIFQYQRCSDERSFYQLVQAGLVRGANSATCASRCKLYEIYFTDRL